MRVSVVAVGKMKEKFYASACAEYQKRLGAFCSLDVIELAESRLPKNPSPAEINAALNLEAAATLAAIPKGAAVIALAVEGDTLSSEAFAERLERMQTGGVSKIALVIGGSHGLAVSLKKGADMRLSMSPMTFPHHLARVMVLEQLYRALSISAGTAYHK